MDRWGSGEVDGGGELYARETPITPGAQLIPPARWAQGPTKLPKLPKKQMPNTKFDAATEALLLN